MRLSASWVLSGLLCIGFLRSMEKRKLKCASLPISLGVGFRAFEK
ncbi:hypothetical protein [Polaromonas sp. CG9_12]|nr:hypothetical protein [Polaromonas sp. CG9_12]